MIPNSTWCRRGPAVLAATLLLVAAFAVSSSAQRRDRTIFASVLDKQTGKPVDAVAPEDIVVREDEVAREVLRVSRLTEPMQLAILVDNSSAMQSHITNIRDGLKAFVETLGEGHEISVVTYADRPTLVTSFSKNRDEVIKSVTRLFAQSSSGAYMMDAIMETAQGFIKRKATRPMIVVVGTEGVEFSNGYYENVLDRLKEAGAQLHVILLTDRDPDNTQEQRYRSIVIDRGTRETGGRRENLLASMAFPEALKTLAAELNSQWRVTYARPESLIPPREVKITSARPTLEVRGVPQREGT